MRRVILIGYMGAGKTTVGRAFAKQAGISFYDLDHYIETRMHKTISQLFEERGEEGFRRLEYNMLHEVAEFEDVIISCGGGTPCFYDNIDYLNAQGDTVYLKASPEVLQEHLRMSRGNRPLLRGKSDDELHEFIQSQLKERAPYYEKARHILEVNVLDDNSKIENLIQQLYEMLQI